jgi:hypothetical protein
MKYYLILSNAGGELARIEVKAIRGNIDLFGQYSSDVNNILKNMRDGDVLRIEAE